jgi:F-type H+-transporting ATPase subunit epsilon
MADKMQFDLVSPERRLASMKVDSVQIPGSDGGMTAMSDHAPTITTLRPGVLRVDGGEGEGTFFVSGGFADIAGASTTILAEYAMPLSEVTADVLDGLVRDAEAKRDLAAKSSGEDGAVDAAAKLLADLAAAREEIKV